MKVREAVAKRLTLPQDAEIMDEYAEETVVRFYATDFGDGDEAFEYVTFDTMEVEDPE